MVEVTVHGVTGSSRSHKWVVILRERRARRYLPIWISRFAAKAIAIGMQKAERSRPLTHDLLKAVIEKLGAKVSHIYINDRIDKTLQAKIVVAHAGQYVKLDSRPSDAIALALRVGAPIFVTEALMERVAVATKSEHTGVSAEEREKLAVFADFLNTLDSE